MSQISWTPFVFLRYTCFLISGIILEIFFPLNPFCWVALNLASLILYVFFFKLLSVSRKYLFQPAFGFLAFVFLFSTGGIITHLKNERNSENHILKIEEEIEWFSGRVSSEVQLKGKWFRAELIVDKIRTKSCWLKRSGRVLIYQPAKDSLQKMGYGDVLLVKGSPKEVDSNDNPYGFDFKKYLSYKQIFHQFFLRDNYSIITKNQGNKVLAFSLLLREKGDRIFKKFIPGKNEANLAAALILGVKHELDDHLKTAYSKIGVMHVLAVSGMHIALIFQVLLLILGRVKQLKNGNLIFGLFSLTLIWLFTFITGISPSVLRAAVMFTFILFSQIFSRQKNTYNNIALSAFCLLIYDPFLITDIGFQLSYLAVFGIVYLFPKIYGLLNLQHRVLDYLWTTIAITIAAQIATSPLSIFYFQQFPSYFLFSNLIIIPLTSAVLYLGIGLLVFFWVPYFSEYVGLLISRMIWFCNQIVYFTESLPFATISGLYVNLFETLLIYSIIALVLVLFHSKNLKYLVTLLVMVSMLSISTIERIISSHNNHQLVIYKQNKIAVVQLKNGEESILINDTDEISCISKEIDGMKIVVWKGKSLMILEKFSPKLSADPARKISIDFLIIRNNSIDSFEEVAKSFNINYVILDPGNSKRISEKLIKDSSRYQFKIHSIATQGPFSVDLSN